MKKTCSIFLAVIALAAVCSLVSADYAVINKGTWPAGWPKELEPLRKQSKTYEGPLRADHHYLIPFTKREEFEAAWPHILKVKSERAPIVLVKASKDAFFAVKPAGVVIHTPATDRVIDRPFDPKVGPLLEDITYIVLTVDGDVVDLNRIPLPQDTPIIDQRFKDDEKGDAAKKAAPPAAAPAAPASEPRPAAPPAKEPAASEPRKKE